MREFDILIKGGRVVDGSGAPSFLADVGVRDEKIVAVGKLDRTDAVRELDVNGLVVSPGFIDSHSHDDLVFFVDPTNASKLMQGVTTVVTGNCGASLAPVCDEHEDELMDYLSYMTIGLDMKFRWRSFREYLDALEARGLGVNVLPQVGHSTIRIATMGMECRDPTPSEMEEMKRLLAGAFEDGAKGFSVELGFPPGSYAGVKELIELCKVAKVYGGFCSFHIRDEANSVVEAVKEVLEVQREAGVPTIISHHKILGSGNWGKSEETLRLVDEARARGAKIGIDVYPYLAISNYLKSLFPPWALAGGVERLISRLRDEVEREIIRKEILEGDGWENKAKICGWENIVITYSTSKDLVGKSISEIARAEGKDPVDVLFDLTVKERGETTAVMFGIGEEDLKRIMKHPAAQIGSDGVPTFEVGRPHPRLNGTFPRVIRKYVREEGVLSLEEAVKKMTSIPAGFFGIEGRGMVREGFCADLAIFDLQRIADRSTFDNPSLLAKGVEYVLVNGELVVDEGEVTGRTPGKILDIHKA
jgi:N-acyl-D-aspartate/D-glutamate deacylase